MEHTLRIILSDVLDCGIADIDIITKCEYDWFEIMDEVNCIFP